MSLPSVTREVLRSLCDTLLAGLEAEGPCFAAARADATSVSEFVGNSIASAPCHVRIGSIVLAHLLDLSIWVTGGTRFRDAEYPARRRNVDRWRESSIRVKRDFIRYVESLAVLHVSWNWYSGRRANPGESRCSQRT